MKSVHSTVTVNSLDDVRREFVRWRASRSGREQTPEALRQHAVVLLQQHCAFHVCRALGINATALKRWAADAHERDVEGDDTAGTMPFVSLDAEPPPTRLGLGSAPTSVLTLELRRGIRVHCKSARSVVELLEALQGRDDVAGSVR